MSLLRRKPLALDTHCCSEHFPLVAGRARHGLLVEVVVFVRPGALIVPHSAMLRNESHLSRADFGANPSAFTTHTPHYRPALATAVRADANSGPVPGLGPRSHGHARKR